MNIKILEQGIFPKDKPSKGTEYVCYWSQHHEGWAMCSVKYLDDGEVWFVMGEPEKPLEECTENELAKKFKEKYYGHSIIVMINQGETYRQALIRKLKQ